MQRSSLDGQRRITQGEGATAMPPARPAPPPVPRPPALLVGRPGNTGAPRDKGPASELTQNELRHGSEDSLQSRNKRFPLKNLRRTSTALGEQGQRLQWRATKLVSRMRSFVQSPPWRDLSTIR